jgi:septal ring factor EnvC (AmiA/AmiB activator)
MPPRKLATLVAPLALLVAALGAFSAERATPARSDAGSLQQGIASDRAREQTLTGSAASAAQVIATLDRQLTVLGGRIATVQAQLSSDRERLQSLTVRTAVEHRLARRLAARFVVQRRVLTHWLVVTYENGRPDALTVLLDANGFSDLLERLDFLQRIGHEDAQVTTATRSARNASRVAATRLAALTVQQTRVTAAVSAESSALASMSAALASRRAALAQARQVELAELSATRTHRLTLQKQLDALLTPPATAASAPAGSYVIPWPIVQCESGGQNLPPNSAAASGYYQIIPSTWALYGGSGPAAYLTSKAEQDAVATRIWNGGTGASNWDCAAMVGITH